MRHVTVFIPHVTCHEVLCCMSRIRKKKNGPVLNIRVKGTYIGCCELECEAAGFFRDCLIVMNTPSRSLPEGTIGY